MMDFLITIIILGMIIYLAWFHWCLEEARREVRREDRDNW